VDAAQRHGECSAGLLRMHQFLFPFPGMRAESAGRADAGAFVVVFVVLSAMNSPGARKGVPGATVVAQGPSGACARRRRDLAVEGGDRAGTAGTGGFVSASSCYAPRTSSCVGSVVDHAR